MKDLAKSMAIMDDEKTKLGNCLHFEMKFGVSDNIEVCIFETNAENGMLQIMGSASLAFKWDSCDQNTRIASTQIF